MKIETNSTQGSARGSLGAGLAAQPEKIGPVGEALAGLFNSVELAQKNHAALETQLSPVLSCYPVNPFDSEEDGKRETTGCRLSDDIFRIQRMVNLLVDRQEAMIRGVQL